MKRVFFLLGLFIMPFTAFAVNINFTKSSSRSSEHEHASEYLMTGNQTSDNFSTEISEQNQTEKQQSEQSPTKQPKTKQPTKQPSQQDTTSKHLSPQAPDQLILNERLDSIVVSARRVDSKTPIAYSLVDIITLKKADADASIPTLLENLTSIVTTTEGGTGLGYSRITIRGNDATRTNITINGVTINDAESQQMFWVNIPTIQRYLNSVEVQRGIGTSSAGSGAFGANINMETISPADYFNLSADLSYGSFNTAVSTIALSTGVSPKGYGANAAYSYSRSDGFLRGGWSRLQSGYLTAAKKGDKHTFTFLALYGKQRTGITWNGVTAEEMALDRRYNSAGQYLDENGEIAYYQNESDNYRQWHLQLHHKTKFSQHLNLVSTLNYTRGDGYYENYHQDWQPQHSLDSITRSNMGNNYYVAMTTLNYVSNRWRLSASLNWSSYVGFHQGDVIWKNYSSAQSPYLYRNNAVKGDYGGYINAKYNLTSRLVLWGDVQYREIDYALKGNFEYTRNLDYNFKYRFINPKGGVMFNINRENTLFSSIAMSHKEPSRTDILESAGGVKPETMIDYELGYRLKKENFSFEGNLYFMEYKDQLATTGRIDSDGYAIKENVEKSYRRGIELSASWAPAPFIQLKANTTLSSNKVVGIGDLSYSPSVIAMGQISLFPIKNGEISVIGKCVGKQYCDNLSTPENMLPDYFVANLSCLYSWKSLDFNLNINNLFDAKYVSYGYAGGYYFPQPGINASFSVSISLY